LAGKNTNPLASLARVFPPLTDNFYILGQLFSDLASKNSQLPASLASVFKNVSTPMNYLAFKFIIGFDQILLMLQMARHYPAKLTVVN
jgi:hypothetical protein